MSTATVARPQLAHLTAQLDEPPRRGTFFKLRELDDAQAPVCTYDGRKVINLASNNYLGLCNHPKLAEAAIDAIREHGVGSGAVRTIAGTMRIHMELEERSPPSKTSKPASSSSPASPPTPAPSAPSSARTTSSCPTSSTTPPSSTAPASHGQNQGLPPQGRRPLRRAAAAKSSMSPARNSSSPTASFRWTATSARSASSPRWPKSTAPS